MKLILTRRIIFAAAQDAATVNMRRHGREVWNDEDWDVGVAVYEKLARIMLQQQAEAAQAALRG